MSEIKFILNWTISRRHKSNFFIQLFEPGHGKTVYAICDQQKAQIGIFVIRCLDSIIPILAKSNLPRLISLCSRAGWFESNLVANPRTGFLTMWLIFPCVYTTSCGCTRVQAFEFFTLIPMQPFWWQFRHYSMFLLHFYIILCFNIMMSALTVWAEH